MSNLWRVNWRKKKDKEGDYLSVVCGTERVARRFLDKLLKDPEIDHAYIGEKFIRKVPQKKDQ